MSLPILGFVGFGEAGSRIAAGLREAGAGDLFAYDIAAPTSAGERIGQRASDSRVVLVDSNAELASRASIIFSLVTASSALEAARQNLPYLTAANVYVDGNSVSPATKREIGTLIQSGGAQFVEAALMAPVPKLRGQSVPMLLNGNAAPQLAPLLRSLGFSFELLDEPFGTAAAVKMCRSIVVKGLEAIMTECALAATEFGADDRVFASLDRTHPGIEWKRLADYMVNRVVVHGERRAREMEQVAETLRSVGIEPIMSEAAARRQDWAARLGLAARFGPEGPTSYREVVEVLKPPK